MINSEKGQRLTDQIKALRRQLASEMGFILPAVRIQDNMQLGPNAYMVRIKEIEAGGGEVRPNMLLTMDPRGEPMSLPGEDTVEPTFGLPALWVSENNKEEALFRGYTVVDPPTVITTHITELVKDNMAEMLSYGETQRLLDELDKDHQKLIEDLVPNLITVGGIQRVLQNLLIERVSIRDLATILEAINEACVATRNVTAITEHVRSRLARQLSDSQTGPDGFLPIISLSPDWETGVLGIPPQRRRRDPPCDGAVETPGLHSRDPAGVRPAGDGGHRPDPADEPRRAGRSFAPWWNVSARKRRSCRRTRSTPRCAFARLARSRTARRCN